MNEISSPGLKEWLDHVDNELIPQAVDHLKLGLYSELSPFYNEAKDIHEPSTLFYFMLNKCFHNNLPKTLKIYLHVLRSLGGTLKGPQLVGDAFGVSSRFRIEDPGVLDISKMSVNFKFFQCLLKIAIQARKVALGEQLMKRFCKERFLNRNYRELKGIPELFISLHQAEFIAADFTHHLMEALNKYKSQICIQHMNDYHKSVGLRSVVFSDTRPGVFSSSPNLRNGRDLSGEFSNADVRRHGSSRDLDRISVFNESTANGSANGSYRRTSRPNEPKNYEVIEASDTDHLLPKGYGIQSSYCSTRTGTTEEPFVDHSKRRRFICVITIGVLIVLFAAAMFVILGSTVWIHLSRPPESSPVPVRQGNTIILGDFNTFYYDSVNVGINPGHYPNVTDEIFYVDFYGISHSCYNLPGRNLAKRNIHVVFSEKNITEFIPTYALAGSSFQFVLKGKAANGKGENDLVKVCTHVGATYGSGKQLECMKVSLDDSSGTWDVEEPGYYYFTVEPLNGPVTFSFNITGSLNRIRVSFDQLLKCSLDNNVSSCSLPLPFTGRGYCMIAEFYRLPYNYLRTALDVSVGGKRVGVVLAATLVPLIGCIVLILLLAIVSHILCIKCLTKIRSNTLNSLTYSI